jgi:hypothetical protein
MIFFSSQSRVATTLWKPADMIFFHRNRELQQRFRHVFSFEACRHDFTWESEAECTQLLFTPISAFLSFFSPNFGKQLEKVSCVTVFFDGMRFRY